MIQDLQSQKYLREDIQRMRWTETVRGPAPQQATQQGRGHIFCDPQPRTDWLAHQEQSGNRTNYPEHRNVPLLGDKGKLGHRAHRASDWGGPHSPFQSHPNTGSPGGGSLFPKGRSHLPISRWQRLASRKERAKRSRHNTCPATDTCPSPWGIRKAGMASL